MFPGEINSCVRVLEQGGRGRPQQGETPAGGAIPAASETHLLGALRAFQKQNATQMCLSL